MKDSGIFLTLAKVGENGAINADASQKIRSHLAAMPGKEALISITPKDAIAGALDVLPLAKIIEDLKHLQNLCGRNCDHTDINQVLDLLNELSEWLPYSGRIQANCKYYLLAAETNAFDRLPDEIKATSERRDWRKAQTAEYAALYEQAERTCAAITHRCDHLRTFVSYAKSELSFNAFPSGTPK
jgi:hypothetical protein